jgi:pentatricopeptide repeat protein
MRPAPSKRLTARLSLFCRGPRSFPIPQGIQPEVRTYNTIITACNKGGRPEQGLAIYERMVRAGVAPTATTYTALISAYGKQVGKGGGGAWGLGVGGRRAGLLSRG